MSSITMSSAASHTISWGQFARVGVATVIAAVVANILVYFIGSTIVSYDPGFVVLANVSGTIIFTIVPAIGAVLIYAALLRFTRRPALIFTIISAIVFVITLIPDFTYIPTVPGSSPAQTAILILMHIVAAGVIVWMLTTRTRSQAQ